MQTLGITMAEGVGFEPTVPLGTTVFKTAALNHSAIPPDGILEYPNDIHLWQVVSTPVHRLQGVFFLLSSPRMFLPDLLRSCYLCGQQRRGIPVQDPDQCPI